MASESNCKIIAIKTAESPPPSSLSAKLKNGKRFRNLFSLIITNLYNNALAFVEASTEGLTFKLSNSECDAHVSLSLVPDSLEKFECTQDIPTQRVDLKEIAEFLKNSASDHDEIVVFQFIDKPDSIFVKSDHAGTGILAPLSSPSSLPDFSLPDPSGIYEILPVNLVFALSNHDSFRLDLIVEPESVKFGIPPMDTPLAIRETVLGLDLEGSDKFKARFDMPNAKAIARALAYRRENSITLCIFKGPPARMTLSISIEEMGNLTFLTSAVEVEEKEKE